MLTSVEPIKTHGRIAVNSQSPAYTSWWMGLQVFSKVAPKKKCGKICSFIASIESRRKCKMEDNVSKTYTELGHGEPKSQMVLSCNLVSVHIRTCDCGNPAIYLQGPAQIFSLEVGFLQQFLVLPQFALFG